MRRPASIALGRGHGDPKIVLPEDGVYRGRIKEEFDLDQNYASYDAVDPMHMKGTNITMATAFKQLAYFFTGMYVLYKTLYWMAPERSYTPRAYPNDLFVELGGNPAKEHSLTPEQREWWRKKILNEDPYYNNVHNQYK